MSVDKHFPDDVLLGSEDPILDLDVDPGQMSNLSAALWGEDPETPLEASPGMFQDDSGVADLGRLMESSVQDLSWLKISEQDAERLPENTETGTVIPELEEAWGQHVQADARYPALDREKIAYERSQDRPVPEKHKSASDLRWVVQRAMRRSARGEPLQALLQEARQAAGRSAPRVAKALAWVKEDHGLAGRVFLRAEAYPGCAKGKWKSELPKIGRGARYLVSKQGCGGCVHNRGGSCSVFARKLVATVPWEEAQEIYQPLLEATGRQVAADATPRLALKMAFTAPQADVRAAGDHLPTHTAPSQRVTAEEAVRAFQETPREPARALDNREAELSVVRRKAQLKIAGWVKSGLLTREAGSQIVRSDLSPGEMLRRAATQITRPLPPEAYSGVSNDVRPTPASPEHAREAMAEAAKTPGPAPVDISHREPAARRKQAHRQLLAWHRKEWLTREDCRRLVQSQADPRLVLKAAATLITRQTGSNPYTGQPNERTIKLATPEQVWASLKKAAEGRKEVQSQVDATVAVREHQATREYRLSQDLQRRADLVRNAMRRGLKGKALRNHIARVVPREHAKEILGSLGPDLQAALQSAPPKRRSYDGVRYEAAPGAGKKAKVASAREVRDCVQWTRRQLHYGLYGTRLKQGLRSRFAAHVIGAAMPALRDLIQAEGIKARQKAAKKKAELEVVLSGPGYDPDEFKLGREAELEHINFNQSEDHDPIQDIQFGGMLW